MASFIQSFIHSLLRTAARLTAILQYTRRHPSERKLYGPDSPILSYRCGSSEGQMVLRYHSMCLPLNVTMEKAEWHVYFLACGPFPGQVAWISCLPKSSLCAMEFLGCIFSNLTAHYWLKETSSQTQEEQLQYLNPNAQPILTIQTTSTIEIVYSRYKLWVHKVT